MRIAGSVLLLPLAAWTIWAQGQASPPAAQAPATDPAAIAGTVVNSHTGEPLKRAQITLTAPTGSSEPITGITDSAGKFQLPGIPAGTYKVAVSRNGFIRPHAKTEDTTREPSTLTLQPKQVVGDLVYHLAPGSVVSGVVLDEDNQPMADVRMECLEYAYRRSGRQLTSCGFTTTDDRGQYRISGLTPGRYFMRATYVDPIQLVGKIHGAAPQAYPSLFYPGVKEAAQAGEIAVEESAERTGVDFKLGPARAVHVQGQVRTPDGRLAGNVLVTLRTRGAIGLGGISPVRTGGDGLFHFEGVTAGSYLLTAAAGGTNTAQMLEVGEADLDNVRMFLSPRVDIRGKVRIEGDKKVAIDGVPVYLAPSDESVLLMAGAGIGSVDGEGNFVFHAMGAGDYQVMMDNLPEDAYLKSARVGNQPLEDMMLHFQGTAGSLVELVVSGAGGHLEGSLTDDQQKPVANLTVVLVPDAARRSRGDLYRTVATDQYGHFTIRGIAPGDYKLFAWAEDLEAWSWLDPSVLAPYEGQGKSVSVGESSRQAVELQTIAVK